MKIRMVTSLVALTFLGLSLTGCYSVRGTEGPPGLYGMNVRQEFTVGKSTERQVRGELGKPARVIPGKDGTTTLVYDAFKFTGLEVVLYNPARTEKHKVVRMTFDRKGILQKIRVRRFTRNVSFGHPSDDRNP